jgi:hypothetical protein
MTWMSHHLWRMVVLMVVMIKKSKKIHITWKNDFTVMEFVQNGCSFIAYSTTGNCLMVDKVLLDKRFTTDWMLKHSKQDCGAIYETNKIEKKDRSLEQISF